MGVTAERLSVQELDPVKDSDDSTAVEARYTHGISIDNLVYLGVADELTCNSTQARNLAVGTAGENITYCFIVENTGDSYLARVIVENDDLDFADDNGDGLLAPGQMKILSLQRSLVADMVNTVRVYAVPVTPQGNELPTPEVVTSSDASAVETVDVLPGIKLSNTLALSHDEGICETDAVGESVVGTFGTKVTYCLTIRNTGDTILDGVVLQSSDLKFLKDDFGALPKGGKITVAIKSKITADNTVNAKTTAYSLLQDGTMAFDDGPVTSQDDSKVELIPLHPGVAIRSTVYAGADGGTSCFGGPDTEFLPRKDASGMFGSPSFYCLNVTNVGETHLSDIAVAADALGFFNKTTDLLSPGQSMIFSVPSEFDADLSSLAVVTASPSLEDGTEIPIVTNVSDTDASAVSLVAHSPSVKIVSTVYVGDNDGASCGLVDAVKFVESYRDAVVTYCFEVSNTGDSYLDDVHVSDASVGFDDNSIGRLAPGGTATLAFVGTIQGAVKNVATVVANPTLHNGVDIPQIDDVSDSDYTAVDELMYTASIAIENTVYIGKDLGLSCEKGAGAKEVSSSTQGESLVYCFKVTNTGETYLNNPTVTNDALGLVDGSIHVLAPKQSEFIVFTSTISQSLENTAHVTAQPALENGQTIADAGSVTAIDQSSVLLKSLVDGSIKQGDKFAFAPTDNAATQCLQDNYRDAGNDENLICASNEVVLESVFNEVPLTCSQNEMITVTIDASMRMPSGPRFDLGWYVATDGGDALEGTCVVNGFMQGNSYEVRKDGDVVAPIIWDTELGADGDECGDIVHGGGTVSTPFLIEATLPCMDADDDGSLDFAVCFTWRDGDDGDSCTLDRNIPAGSSGGCYCARYGVANIQVKEPFNDNDESVACI